MPRRTGRGRRARRRWPGRSSTRCRARRPSSWARYVAVARRCEGPQHSVAIVGEHVLADECRDRGCRGRRSRRSPSTHRRRATARTPAAPRRPARSRGTRAFLRGGSNRSCHRARRSALRLRGHVDLFPLVLPDVADPQVAGVRRRTRSATGCGARTPRSPASRCGCRRTDWSAEPCTAHRALGVGSMRRIFAEQACAATGRSHRWRGPGPRRSRRRRRRTRYRGRRRVRTRADRRCGSAAVGRRRAGSDATRCRRPGRSSRTRRCACRRTCRCSPRRGARRRARTRARAGPARPPRWCRPGGRAPAAATSFPPRITRTRPDCSVTYNDASPLRAANRGRPSELRDTPSFTADAASTAARRRCASPAIGRPRERVRSRSVRRSDRRRAGIGSRRLSSPVVAAASPTIARS